MVMVFGRTQRVTVTSVSGFRIWHKGTVCTSGKMEIVMRESGEVLLDMVKALIFSLTGMFL